MSPTHSRDADGSTASGPPRLPIRVSERQFDRLVEEQVLVCFHCGAIGPTGDDCLDEDGHGLVTAPDAELSGVLVVDWPDDA